MAAQGSIFRRYLPLRAFRGEVGVLYLCSDLSTRVPVGVKTVEPELAPGSAFLDAARRWVELGEHPNIVCARCIQQEDPLCLVVDFVEPASGVESPALRSWMGSTIVPEAACAIALGVARGMCHATGKVPGLVHGDLRPENVLIGRDLRARVTNFGLGLRAPALAPQARYWAPERWTGSASIPSDIYAFGLTLAEMLTGAIAVPTEDAEAIEEAHRLGAPRQGASSSGIPADLLPLIEACLAASPSERPDSWERIAGELGDLWPRVSGLEPPRIPDELSKSRDEVLMRAWSSQAIAHALRDRGATEPALVAYRGVARTAAREGDPTLEASAVSQVARMLQTLGEFDAALRELWHALSLRRAMGDGSGQAVVLCMLGDVYACQGDLDNALGVLFAAARLFAEEGDRRGVASCRMQMVPLLNAAGRTTEAREAESESRLLLADLRDKA